MPRGTLDPFLSFPASSSDVRRWLPGSRSRATLSHFLVSTSSSPAQISSLAQFFMDIDRGEARSGHKRLYAATIPEADRRYEAQLRERLDEERWRRERDRDGGREHEPERRREEFRRQDDDLYFDSPQPLRYEPPPPQRRKKMAVRKSTVSANTKRWAEASQSAPPPSTAVASQFIQLRPFLLGRNQASSATTAAI